MYYHPGYPVCSPSRLKGGFFQLQSFSPGLYDHTGRLSLPQRLYGRDESLTVLEAAFERVSQGGCEMVLVTGTTGIGKSSLVDAFSHTVTDQGGFCVAGTSEVLQQHAPYLAITQALQALLLQCALHSESAIAAWRECLGVALGSNGQIMLNLLPESAWLIGQPSALADTSPIEAQQRFYWTLHQFVTVFAQPAHPLVLLLDDAQWIDTPTLRLLEWLLTPPMAQSRQSTPALLVVLSYQDDEVDAAHPLQQAQTRLNQANIPITTIPLLPLDVPAVTALIADTVRCSAERAAPLAKVVMEKTGGVPFFIHEFLSSLEREGLIWLRQEEGIWHWNLNALQTREVVSPVAQALTYKVRQMEPHTQHLLQVAACLGTQFELAMLADLIGHSPVDIACALEPAIGAGLMVYLSDTSQALDLQTADPLLVAEIVYEFAHPAIRQAGYALLPDVEREDMHWQAGQFLLRHLEPGGFEEQLFELVDHLNQAQALANGEAERAELAALNLRAGRKARAIAACELAQHYLQMGISLLGTSGWQNQYELMLALHNEAVEIAYGCCDFSRIEESGDTILRYARTALDTVLVAETRIRAYTAQGRYQQAIETMQYTVQRLGFQAPIQDTKVNLLTLTLYTRMLLLGKRIEALADLPPVADPHTLAAMRLIAWAADAAYFSASDQYILLTLKNVQFSITRGNAPSSIAAYAAYGFILAGVMNDIERGYSFGQLALDLLGRVEDQSLAAHTLLIVYGLIWPWKHHLNRCVPLLREGYQRALETGATDTAAVFATNLCIHLWLQGCDLVALDQEMTAHTRLIGRHQAPSILAIHRIYHQVLRNLLQFTSVSPLFLRGDVYNETHPPTWQQDRCDRAVLFVLYSLKMWLCYLFDEPVQAAVYARAAHCYRDVMLGSPVLPGFTFHDSLVHLALLTDTADAARQTKLLRRVEHNQKQLEQWAHHAPMNYLHKWQLVAAEEARVTGKEGEARVRYDEAIAGARAHGYVQEEALACELAGRFYLTLGRQALAQVYLREARSAYERWGAAAKVVHLEALYPELLTGIAALDTNQDSVSRPAQEVSYPLNLISVIKAAQTISAEMKLDALLSRLMPAVIESAGAERGVLVLKQDDAWFIAAEGRIDSAVVTLHESLPLADGAVPVSLLTYAIHGQAQVVLHDMPTDGAFAQDSYIITHRPRSVLCLPLFHQGNLTGMLYLENMLISGIFTLDRLEVLDLLRDQIVTSLENAHLHGEIESLLGERTAQLATAIDEARAANAVAAEANHLKSRFIANMSHELRTPLNSIINFTRIVSSGMRWPVTEGQLDYLNRVQASGEHLLGLINDILDISRIEAGRLELFKEQVQLADLVQSIMSTAIGLTRDKSITLHHEIADDLPTIEADRTRIRQVLLHLLSNAVKFTSEGSITIRAWREQGSIVVSVSDTGIGIAADKLDVIFEEFRQADEGSARLYEGTGLGLAICKQLIEMHHGRFWVESVVDVGSTFFFSLPIAAAASTVTPEVTPKDEQVATLIGTGQDGVPILVVDDDIAAIEIIASYLGKAGYAIHGVIDSQLALEEARRLHPAAVILDVLMPHKDGWEVLTDLKADPDLRDIPVILYTIVEEQKIGLHLGASAYLVKPIQEDLLRTTVGKFVTHDATILAIDDSQDVLETIDYYLGTIGGYRVVQASGGHEGLEQVHAVQPDLIILDLMMPEIDGFAVLKSLDKNPQTRSIPVVVLTAKDLTTAERTYLSGRVQYLQHKGATSSEELLRHIRTFVTRSELHAPGSLDNLETPN